jgi:type I restriction enzyme S subunit
MSAQPYPKYKSTNLPWLDKIPEHWNMMRLKRVAQLQPSNVDKKSKEGEEPVRLCNYVDVYKNEFIHPGLDLMEATAPKAQIKKFKVEAGDVIITKDSESWDDIAVPAYVESAEENMVCGYHLTQVKPSGTMLGKYMFRCFRADGIKSQFETAAVGVTRYALSKRGTDSAFFPVPSPEEQAVIVEYLDRETGKIDELVAEKKNMLGLLEEKRQAIITDAVTGRLQDEIGLPNPGTIPSGIDWLGDIPKHWKMKRLKVIAKVQPSNVDKKSKEGEEPVRLCNYVDVYKNEFIHPKLNLMEATAPKAQRKKFRVEVGDVIVTKDSESWDDIAVPAYVESAEEDMVCGYHLSQIKPSDEILGKYLFRCFVADGIKDQFQIAAVGVTRYALSKRALDTALFPVPPQEEQEAIIDFIDKKMSYLDDLASEIKAAIDLLKEHRTALVTAAVTGQIDVREV